jgi:hypothetical protein
MALTAIADGVTVQTKKGLSSWSRDICILSTQGRTSLSPREALKLGKILVAFGEKK